VRILIYQDYLRVGGTESQTVFLAPQFQEKGNEVLVLTNRPGGALASVLARAGIRQEALQRWDTGLNWFAPGWNRRIGMFAPDLILLMGRNANRMGWRIRKKHPHLPLIATMRTGRRLTGDYLKTLRVADKILCNSQWAAKRLQHPGIAPERIEVHPNACLRGETILQRQQPHGKSSTCQSRDPRITLLYVAAFVPGKNHLGMLEWLAPWFKLHQEVRLLLVGEGPERRKVEKQVTRLGMGEQICFTGFVHDVSELYCHADLAISVSLEESMPNAIVEAQYAGLPVIALDVAGVSECLVDGTTGFLIEVGDENAFLKRLDQLLGDEELRTSMGAQARAFARASFDPKERMRLFLDSLHEVAQSVGR
jgi:glycosyltransferase involved in cell wall biosynthesis